MIPAEIGNWEELKHLYLWKNQFSGSIPPSIGELRNLTELSLGENRLSGELPQGVRAVGKFG